MSKRFKYDSSKEHIEPIRKTIYSYSPCKPMILDLCTGSMVSLFPVDLADFFSFRWSILVGLAEVLSSLISYIPQAEGDHIITNLHTATQTKVNKLLLMEKNLLNNHK